MYYFVYLLYEHTNDDFFDNISKISEDSPKVIRKPDKLFRKSSEVNFPRKTEDFCLTLICAVEEFFL